MALGADPFYSFTAVGTAIYHSGRSSDKKKRKRKKKKRERAALLESERRRALAKLRFVLGQVSTMQAIAKSGSRKARAELAAVGEHVVKIGDDDEVEIILREAKSIRSQLDELDSLVREYEIAKITGSEPGEFIVPEIKKASKGLAIARDARRASRGLWARARGVALKAAKIHKAEQDAARIAEVKRRELDRRSVAPVRGFDLERFRASDLEWLERMRGRGRFRPSDAWSGTMNNSGLGGVFEELFGTAKKKDKRKEEKKKKQRKALALLEVKEQADRRRVRRKAQIRQAFNSVNTELSSARGWLKRIQRSLTDTPGLSSALVAEAMAKVNSWEATIQAVSTGMGELDTGSEVPGEQDSILIELQAALGAMRTLGVQATRLKRKVDAAVAVKAANAARLSSLIKQQQALDAREKAAQAGLLKSRAQQARTSAQKQRIDALRLSARAGSKLQAERAALALMQSQLREEERRASMMAAFRSGRSVVPFLSPGVIS